MSISQIGLTTIQLIERGNQQQPHQPLHGSQQSQQFIPNLWVEWDVREEGWVPLFAGQEVGCSIEVHPISEGGQGGDHK